jgi:hypothetical protein
MTQQPWLKRLKLAFDERFNESAVITRAGVTRFRISDNPIATGKE